MERREDIRRSAEEILQEFLRVTKDLPQLEESYYITAPRGSRLREDAEPSPKSELEDFRKRFLSLASCDELGNIRVEVAKWKEL